MNENEARGEFLHEYLGDTPHLFSLDKGSTVSIQGNGKEVLHTGSRNINTMEELKDIVDRHPEFMKMLRDN